MNKKVQYKGQFRVYIMWPLYAAILLLILDIVLFTQNITCGIVGVAFTLVYGVCALIFLLRKQPLLTKAMVEFAADYAQVQKTLLEDFKGNSKHNSKPAETKAQHKAKPRTILSVDIIARGPVISI